MRRFRVSIGLLMIVVGFVAVGVAALRDASELWAGTLALLALGMLGVAILGAIYGRAERRAFWLGFLIFGGGYGLLAFGPWFVAEVRPKLLTTTLFDRLHRSLDKGGPNVVGGVTTGATWAGNSQWVVDVSTSNAVPVQAQSAGGAPQLVQWLVTTPNANGAEHLQRVGHTLSLLLAAGLGGLIARWFHARRDRSDDPPPVAS